MEIYGDVHVFNSPFKETIPRFSSCAIYWWHFLYTFFALITTWQLFWVSGIWHYFSEKGIFWYHLLEICIGYLFLKINARYLILKIADRWYIQVIGFCYICRFQLCTQESKPVLLDGPDCIFLPASGRLGRHYLEPWLKLFWSSPWMGMEVREMVLKNSSSLHWQSLFTV